MWNMWNNMRLLWRYGQWRNNISAIGVAGSIRRRRPEECFRSAMKMFRDCDELTSYHINCLLMQQLLMLTKNLFIRCLGLGFPSSTTRYLHTSTIYLKFNKLMKCGMSRLEVSISKIYQFILDILVAKNLLKGVMCLCVNNRLKFNLHNGCESTWNIAKTLCQPNFGFNEYFLDFFYWFVDNWGHLVIGKKKVHLFFRKYSRKSMTAIIKNWNG